MVKEIKGKVWLSKSEFDKIMNDRIKQMEDMFDNLDATIAKNEKTVKEMIAIEKDSFHLDNSRMSNVDWLKSNWDVKHKYALLPKTCNESKKKIWLRKYFEVSRHKTVAYSSKFSEARYFDEVEYIKLKLQA